MKGRKQKRSRKNIQTTELGVSSEQVAVVEEMPPADLVAEERARELRYMRALAELADSGCRDVQPVAPPLPAPPAASAAAATLSGLAAALRPTHDVRFLEEYTRLLQTRPERELHALADQLIRSVEDVLGEGGRGVAETGGVVLGGWLCAAAAWSSPHTLSALHGVLQQLSPAQVAETARALHAALTPRELLAARDGVRGAGGGRLAALLLRAALARLAEVEPEWREEAPTAAEVCEALEPRWNSLSPADKLAGLALAGRVLAGAGRGEAEALLESLAPPPLTCKDPDDLKVSAAVKTLRNLFKDK